MKRKTLITSILVIVLCLALISGSTYSLFTSESSINMVVTSGKVDVSATVTDIKVYSATADTNAQLITTDLAGEIQTGPFAGTYYYQGPLANNTFANGGTAAWATDTKVLTIDKITPGDKVTLNVDVQNNSNVAIQYRVRVNVLSGLKLYEGLVVKTDNISLSGVQKVGNWTYLPYDANTTALATIPVEIYLPLEAGNTYQDLSTSLRITVEAVQGNAKTTNEVLAQEVTATANVGTTNTVLSDNDGLVEATVPTAALADTSISSLTLKVKPQDTVSNITITSLQETLSYDVKVLETTTTNNTSAIKENNTAAITVRMFVGTGLTGVKLYHNTDEITAFTYDSTTGYIQFTTNSFSEYTVVYNKEIAVETVNEQTQQSTITVYTPTEAANVYKDEEGNTVKVTINETTNEPVVDTDGGVAYIASVSGTVFYETLNAALADSENGTIVLMKDITSDDGFLIEKTTEINTNGKTITVNVGSNVNNRAFKVVGQDVKLTVNGGGTIDAKGQATSSTGTAGTGCYGAFRAESKSILELSDLTLKNYRPWGLNVKVCGAEATIDNVTIISICGGGIEVTDDDDGVTGYAKLTNCTMTQSDYRDWCSVPVAASYNSVVDVYSTKYTGEYGVYIFTSGGTINIYGGDFKATSNYVLIAEADTYSYPTAVSTINVYDGTFVGEIKAPTKEQEKILIYGGTFDHDPTAYVQDGYGVNFENEKYTVYSQLSVLATQLVEEGYTNVSLNLEDGYVLGTYTDDVVYYFAGNDVIYVYDATNYNGYYGEATSDITTYYVGKLVPVTNIAGGAFNNATNTTKLVITKNLSSAKKVLNGNTNITTVEFGAGVTKVNDRLFYRSNVSTVILTDSITTIESGAFFEAHSITELNIPASVTSIGDQAFAYCDSLTTITINGNPTIDLYFIGRACDSLINVWFNGTPTFTNSKTTSQTFTREESGQSYPIVIHFTTQELLNAFDAIDSSSTGLTLEVID